MKRFMKRHDIIQVNPRMLESSRVKWRTAGNAQLMYHIYGKLLVECGLGTVNGDYDPSIPNSNPVIINHPAYIVRLVITA
jgi:hypothetical protein